jgi:lambda family phage minor tail protein L
MTLAIETRKQAPTGKVDLYILDLNPIGVSQIYFFYPGTGADNLPLNYLGQTYNPWPVVMSGFVRKGDGSENRPKASISNINGAITGEVDLYDDLVGATLTRRRTHKSFIDADISEFYDESYEIEQKTAENSTFINFDLSSPLDYIDKQLPGRLAIANACPWRYKSTANGSGCSWPGIDSNKWFDRNGDPVMSSTLDECGKRLSDCKLRFGANNELDYGGFPSLGRNG